jgi:hypothetical protein
MKTAAQNCFGTRGIPGVFMLPDGHRTYWRAVNKSDQNGKQEDPI